MNATIRSLLLIKTFMEQAKINNKESLLLKSLTNLIELKDKKSKLNVYL